MVRCEHLELRNFRNYARLELDLPAGVIVLQGENAQGKTNLLEALHIVATTRSSRGAPERDWIHWLAFEEPLPFARIGARVRRANSTVLVEVVAAVGENGTGVTKRMKINGALRRAVDVVGQVKVVLFSPQDIDLVAGGPAQRRRYLNIMNAQVDPKYLRALQLYERVILQRNSLLRLIRDRQARPDQLDYWDKQLAEHGAYVIDRRREALQLLNELIAEIHPALTADRERLVVSYRPNLGNDLPVEPLPPLAELPATILAAVQALRPREVAQGASLVGPHRDDFQLTTDGTDLTAFGSRGQQRTAALALKLAEAEFIRRRAGDQPVLLLDDVMSELDARRRRQVLAAIRSEQQVVITTTDLDDFEPTFLDHATILRVKAGRIERAR